MATKKISTTSSPVRHSGLGALSPSKELRMTHEQFAAITELQGKYPLPLRSWADAIRALIARQQYLKPADVEKVAATFRLAEPAGKVG